MDASVSAEPTLPPVAERDRRFVFDGFRLTENSEYPVSSVVQDPYVGGLENPLGV
jgi:hypothetical protein